MEPQRRRYLNAGLALLCLLVGAATATAYAAAEPVFDGGDALFYAVVVAVVTFVPTYVYVSRGATDDRDAAQPT